ncbi:MAG: FAD:protein FMN transferase, partial [Woeseiaceae bacterium]|nr:FAD:protein FMN transferase [Woeseiaceae bacterium]
MRHITWLALLVLCACSEKQPPQHTFTGHSMGTQFSVKLTTDNVDTAALKEALEVSLTEVNDMMSTYQPDSEISRFNSNNTT